MKKIEKFLFEHPVLTDLLTILVPAAFIIAVAILTNSCGTVKEVPVQTVEKIIQKDSLIYINDTVTIEIPKEVVKEVLPALDTSYLKTSVAESVAYLDTTKRQIHHTLAQKGQLQAKLDTIIVVEHVDRIVEKEVPITVEIETVKYKRDALFWVLVGWALICISYLVIKWTV